jgi:hypothetical protein
MKNTENRLFGPTSANWLEVWTESCRTRRQPDTAIAKT